MKRFAVLAAVVVMLLMFTISMTGFAFTINSTANGGDVVSIAGNTNITEDTGGNSVTIMGNTEIEADVGGDVVVIMGNCRINAAVGGDVVVVLGTVTLTDKARIGGDLVSIGSVEETEGAVIGGEKTAINLGLSIGSFNVGFLTFIMIAMLVLSLFFILVLGLPLMVIMQQRFRKMSAGSNEGLGRMLAIGFLALLGSFIAMIIFCWTVVVPIAYFVLIIIANIAASVVIGKYILKVFNTTLNVYMEFITGISTIALVKLIMILLLPENGVVIGLLASTAFDVIINSLGIGVLIDSKFGSKSEFV